MDMHLMCYDGLNFLDSHIGCQLANGTFVVAAECADTLEEIIQLLETEDILTRPVRCRLMFIDIVKQILVPLLLNLDEVDAEERDIIFMRVMKLLAHLTQPCECLIPEQHTTAGSRALAKDLDNFITKTQHLFTKADLNRAILTENLNLLQRNGSEKPLPDVLSETINFTVYVYRNLLFTVDKSSSTQCSLPVHAEILRWLLEFGVKDLILQAVVSPQRDFWCIAIVQLISLMFTDERCLDDCVIGSDSSNSFMRTQSLLSCSDSQSNLVKESSESSLEDFSCATLEAKGVDSLYAANCNADFTSNAKKMEEGKKMDCEQQMRYEEAQLHKKVEEADAWNQIRAGMSSFCSDFLRKGWLLLLRCVKGILLNQTANKYQLQPHYFMWLVQHFAQMLPAFSIPFRCIREALSVDTIGYLVHHCVKAFERTKVAKHRQQNLSPFVKQTHLPLAALHQIFNTISHCWENAQGDDKRYLVGLMGFVVGMQDLSLLFVQLSNQVNISFYGKALMQEVILTTHKFLLMADLVHTSGGQSHRPLDLMSYVPHFANQHMMMQYGEILSDFKQNPSILNQSIFTMMHHVAGECGQSNSLLQAPIIQAFIGILDSPSSKKAISQEGHDLMEFILQKCLDTDPVSFMCFLTGINLDSLQEEEAAINEGAESPMKRSRSSGELVVNEKEYPQWTSEERSELFALTAVDQEHDINDIVEQLQDICIDKSYKHVVVEMYRSGMVSSDQVQRELGLRDEQVMCDSDDIENLHSMSTEVRAQHCIQHLIQNEHQDWLIWLQTTLLEAIYVHVVPDICQIRPKEPVFWHCALLGEPKPLVPFTSAHEAAMRDSVFCCLLETFGLHIPDPKGIAYAVIPLDMPLNQLWERALILSPIQPEKIGFDPNDIKMYQSRMFASTPMTPSFESTPMHQQQQASVPDAYMWPMVVQKINSHLNSQ